MTNLQEMPDTIVCEDVFLEKISFLHLEEMYEVLMDNVDYLAPWMPFVKKDQTMDQQYTYIEDCLNEWEEGTRFDFSIYDKKEDLFLGIASVIVRKAKTGIYELGYWVRKDFKGKGIASDIVNTLTDLMINDFNANKVVIRTVDGNIGSIKVAQKSGFLFSHKEYCRGFIDEQMVDDLIFIKLKDEVKTQELQQGQEELKKVFNVDI